MNGPMKFYDSNTGKLLFTAPIGRTMDEFLVESAAHGWPSFRDREVRAFFLRARSCLGASVIHLQCDSHTLKRYNHYLKTVSGYPIIGQLGVRSCPP